MKYLLTNSLTSTFLKQTINVGGFKFTFSIWTLVVFFASAFTFSVFAQSPLKKKTNLTGTKLYITLILLSIVFGLFVTIMFALD